MEHLNRSETSGRFFFGNVNNEYYFSVGRMDDFHAAGGFLWVIFVYKEIMHVERLE